MVCSDLEADIRTILLPVSRGLGLGLFGLTFLLFEVGLLNIALENVYLVFFKHFEVVIEVLLRVGAGLGTKLKNFLQKLFLESFWKTLTLGKCVKSFQIFKFFRNRPNFLIFLTELFTELFLEIGSNKVVFTFEP
jgi:hypothetical protein